MTFAEYQQRLADTIRDLEQNHVDLVLGLGSEALTMIRQRITEDGKAASGETLQSIRDYTPQYKRFKEGKTKHRKGYKPPAGMKAGSNRYRGFVDFTLTTRMWSNTHVTAAGNTAIIAARQEENRNKMAHLGKYWTKVLDLSQKEIDILLRNYNAGILKIFRRNGL